MSIVDILEGKKSFILAQYDGVYVLDFGYGVIDNELINRFCEFDEPFLLLRDNYNIIVHSRLPVLHGRPYVKINKHHMMICGEDRMEQVYLADDTVFIPQIIKNGSKLQKFAQSLAQYTNIYTLGEGEKISDDEYTRIISTHIWNKFDKSNIRKYK